MLEYQAYMLERFSDFLNFNFHVITRNWHAHQQVHLNKLIWKNWVQERFMDLLIKLSTKQFQNLCCFTPLRFAEILWLQYVPLSMAQVNPSPHPPFSVIHTSLNIFWNWYYIKWYYITSYWTNIYHINITPGRGLTFSSICILASISFLDWETSCCCCSFCSCSFSSRPAAAASTKGRLAEPRRKLYQRDPN